MKTIMLGLVLLGALGALPSMVSAQSGADIMQKHRDLHRVRDEEETLTMKIVDRNGAVKQRRLVRYTLTDGGDLSKILVRFLEPRDVEHTGLLTWEAKDGNDDQWLYLPATKRAKRIAASGKKNRFMGTDMAYEDLRAEALALHRYAVVASEALDGGECWVIEAVPATEREAADSGYSKRKLWVRKDTYLVAKREYYDKKGALEKVQLDRKAVNVKGTAWRANEVEMQDVQNGSRTIMLFDRRHVDRGLKESFFTETELIRGGS